MRFHTYQKYQGTFFDALNIQDLLERLADFMLKSGFEGGPHHHPWWGWSGDDPDHSLDELKAAGHECPLTTAWQSWVHLENLSAYHNVPFATEENGFAGLDTELAFLAPLAEGAVFDPEDEAITVGAPAGSA